jgi:hypothetical protein
MDMGFRLAANDESGKAFSGAGFWGRGGQLETKC